MRTTTPACATWRSNIRTAVQKHNKGTQHLDSTCSRPAQGRFFHLMNRLVSILAPEQVLVDVDAASKKRAFEEAGLLFEALHGLSRALVTDSLFARERLGSTGLGHGVAIPHGRIKGLQAPMAAVLRLAQPIGFDAPDEQPVSLLIFLLVPEAATQTHLEILSEIAELLGDAVQREALCNAPDAAALHALIERWEPEPDDAPAGGEAQ